jgi:hypothetical protein
MSCQSKAYASLIDVPSIQGSAAFEFAITSVVVAIIDAFDEALEMRRAAYRRRAFSE